MPAALNSDSFLSSSAKADDVLPVAAVQPFRRGIPFAVSMCDALG